MRSRVGVWIGALVAAGIVGLAESAWAQDYTVTTATGKLETRPAGATQLNLISTQSAFSWTTVSLPFEFPYYAKPCTTLAISAHGCVLPGATAGFGNVQSIASPHGQDAGTGAFPYGTGTNSANGVVAPLWGYWNLINTGVTGTGYAYAWTSGTAPNRHFVASWENGRIGPPGDPQVTVQVHLYEGSGRIVFAYSTNATGYANASWACGLDSPIDARFTLTMQNGTSNAGYPGSDFILDPQTVTLTGTLQYDQLVSDASGIGNTVLGNRPIPGCRVEMRRPSDGFVYMASTTAADGSFSFTNTGLPSASPGALTVVAENAACSITMVAGTPPTEWTSTSSISFASTANVGTYTLGTAGDPVGDVRSAFNVARVFLAARDWAGQRSTDTIPRLATLLNPFATALTSYQKADGPTPALFVVGTRGSTNSDTWDDALLTRTYSRHLLASVAATQTTTPDFRFDAATDTENAFAEAFGYAMWAAISGTSQAIDGTSASTAIVHDLETPTITVTKGPDVAGRVAGALFDLLDPANETIDPVNGTSTIDRFFRLTDAMTSAPTSSAFVQAWVDAGYDAPGLTRAFIGNGVLPDDAFEPNDARTEAPSLGAVGFVHPGLVLHRFNEDWFSVTLAEPAALLFADVSYDRFTYSATVGLEIRDAGGVLLATGAPIGSSGAIHAATAGQVAAGTYRIGVRHLGGVTVPAYTFQVCVPPSLNDPAVPDWTVGRPYDFALGVRDGVLPYVVSTVGGPMPPGLALNGTTFRAFGTPNEAGTFPVTLQLRDGGTPANVVSRTRNVTIHDVLKIGVARFVGFPAGRAVDATLPTIEGTPPFTLTMPVGALPDGLALAPNSFHVTGTAAEQASTTLELDGVDVAGSADHVATRAVVAAATDVSNAPADLAAGADACGWWFDAVQGSSVSFKAKTAKGRVKRLIAAAVLAPDRSEVLTAKVKGKLGGLSVSKLVCPESGRYYVIAASEDGEATQLLGSVSVAAPKSGKAKLVDFTQASTTEIEVGALPGAVLTLKMKGDKKQQLTPKVVSVTDPDGTPVVFGGNVVTDGVTATLTMTLAKGGTWTVVVGATSATGTPGKLSYSYKLAQPKDAAYSAD